MKESSVEGNSAFDRWPLLLGVAATVITLFPYFVMFHNGWSSDQNAWANFGNYVGGAVTPLLSLITIFLVLKTLQIQRSDLALSRLELAKSSQALATQAEQFAQKNVKDDLMVRAELVHKELQKRELGRFRGRFTAQNIPQPAYPAGHEPKLRQLFLGENLRNMLAGPDTNEARALKEKLSPVIDLLVELDQYLTAIDELSGGNIQVTNYYRRRHRELVEQMSAKGYLNRAIANAFEDRAGPANGAGEVEVFQEENGS